MDIRKVLLEIYGERASRRYGLSDVTQLQHALQAASLAEAADESPSLVAASLLHDIGHMTHDLGIDTLGRDIDDRHEETGATWLAQWFGTEVCEPVRLHVEAKYVHFAALPPLLFDLATDPSQLANVAGDPAYANALSTYRAKMLDWRLEFMDRTLTGYRATPNGLETRACPAVVCTGWNQLLTAHPAARMAQVCNATVSAALVSIRVQCRAPTCVRASHTRRARHGRPRLLQLHLRRQRDCRSLPAGRKLHRHAGQRVVRRCQ